MKSKLFLLITGIVVMYSCTQTKYAATNKVYKQQVKNYAKRLAEYPVKDSGGLHYAADWVGTTNLSMRRPNFVIIHHTAQNSCEQTLETFTLARTQVSAHYVICKDGTVHHMLNDLLRAHHAGVSKWGNTTDLNSSSIGIELDNNGFEPFAEAQISSLLTLLDRLKKAYSIPASNFIGHGDIAPTRKNDPNWRFPWKLLAEKGFGYWYDDPANVTIPTGFNHLQALRIVGYDLKDTNAAIIGFKRHWLQDTTKGLSNEQLKVLYQLSRKYMQ
ncbi:MAG: N-acetylmuramoyl-L-alanine amidase [Bacteroidetes bacterium]|nr:N-acetylmuramoyl-L-alanine amidase [Bacteroidota bacterium]